MRLRSVPSLEKLHMVQAERGSDAQMIDSSSVQYLRFRCRWRLHQAAIVMIGFVALGASAGGEEIFAELEDSGVEFHHFNGASGDFTLPEITCAGAALFDYDGDGDLDLYLLQGAYLGAPSDAPDETADRVWRDELYRNDLSIASDGSRVVRFTQVTSASGLDSRGYSCGAAAGDFDNDGWPDLYIASLESNRLFRSRGDGTFEDVTMESGTDDARWSVPTTWFDYDRDGWLDLYVGNYLEFDRENQKTCRTRTGVRDFCNPSAYVGVPDSLFHNRGDGTFEDVSLAAGLAGVASKSLGVVATDFNADGATDLYVTNDGVPNQLWIQTAKGQFDDQALLAGCAVNRQGQPEASMGVGAGDLDLDGDIDLLMTHLVGETNTLFLNDGAGGFFDATVMSGLGVASWKYTSWGVALADYDTDGRLDVAIVNGAVRVIDDLAEKGDPFPFHQPNQLFHNQGNGRFVEVTDRAGRAFARSEVSRALAVGDLDNDGDEDLVLANDNGPARVLINQVSPRGRWLALSLLHESGRDMIGAEVEVETDAGTIVRRVHADGSFGASKDPRVLVGLGDGAEAHQVDIRWPDAGRLRLLLGQDERYFTVFREGIFRKGTGRQ
jgi:hypothetical protein